MANDVAVFFSVVYAHTPQNALIGMTTINHSAPINRFYNYSNDLDTLQEDITKLITKTNIYLRITPLKQKPQNGKRGLERDSAGTSVLWADLDCYESKDQGIEALRKFQLLPTLIVDSGKGLHAYWQLDHFETDLVETKARNKWLYKALSTSDADAVYDLARILRLPGTLNHKYDPPLPTVIVEYNPEAIYQMSDFLTETIEDTQPITVWDHAQLNGGFAITVADRDKKLYGFLTDEVKARKAFSDGNGGLDRSANDAYCVTRLLSLGYTPEQCVSVLIDSRFTTSLKYRDTQRFDYVILTVNNCYQHFLDSSSFYFEKSRFQAQTMANTIVGDQQQFIYTADNIWHYENGRYVRNAEVLIKADVVKRLGTRWSRHCEDETLAYVRSSCYVPIEDCNQRSNEFINCRNGMLNIASGQLEPHDQTFRSLYQLPASYDPAANTTLVDWFVSSLFPQDAIPFFWEFLGSSLLTNQYWPKAFLLLIGAGDTGKSTMLRFIRSILGDDNCSAVTLQALADNRFAVVKLYGKLANIFADLSETEAGDVGQIKAITGDDIVHGEEKFEKGFDFKPTARLIFSANHYPTVRNADQAFFNRARLIRCANQFKGKQADEGLTKRLAQQENLNAALLRMYEGLQRLIQNKAFTHSDSMAHELSQYQTYADSVYGFLNQCRFDPSYSTPKQELYKAYAEATRFAGRQPVTENSFYRRINDQAAKFGLGERRPELDGSRVWCYTGIKPPTDTYTIHVVRSA